MTKVLISSQGNDLDSQVDPRFGRAAQFLLVDTDTMTVDRVDNGAAKNMAQGAGIQAAETAARSGAKAVLSGYVGPKAFTALKTAGMMVCQDMDGLTVRQAVQKFLDGEARDSSAPGKPGHWK